MKKDEELTCTAGLELGIIDEETFSREVALCKKFSKENNGGCCWGRCENCGAIPLLYKLHKGVVVDDASELQKIKKTLLDL